MRVVLLQDHGTLALCMLYRAAAVYPGALHKGHVCTDGTLQAPKEEVCHENLQLGTTTPPKPGGRGRTRGTACNQRRQPAGRPACQRLKGKSMCIPWRRPTASAISCSTSNSARV